jgi:N6-L-threonylcarbamoyladenine synthase
MDILAIETSCDETSAAVVRDGVQVLSNIIATSQQEFVSIGGVIPEEAARMQVECILPVIRKALEQSNVSMKDIDAIAVTRGPGLLGSLLVGTVTARSLSSLAKKPIIGVHHTLGHLSSVWLDCDVSPKFPIITLSASGGHTDIWKREAHTRGVLLGRTRDDAAGEAFDKGAQLLGLPYPGGPSISKAAESGEIDAFDFPLPLKGDEGLDFSFSGLKTALKYTIRDIDNLESHIADLAASYQHALCMHLLDRIKKALELHPEIQEVHIVGGVSANTHLRSILEKNIGNRILRWPVRIPYCTDNAAMIAAAASFLVTEKGKHAYKPFETASSIPLETVVEY